MSKTRTNKISLRGLAEAFGNDLRNLGATRAPRQKGPFPALNDALGEMMERLTAVGNAVVEQRRSHDQTRAQLLQSSLEQDREEIENAAELRAAEAGKPAAGSFVSAGRVIDAASGIGLPGVRVQLIQGEGRRAKVVSESVTEDLGFYRHELRVGTSDSDGTATVAVRVVDAAGKPVHVCDQRLAPKAGEVAVVDVALDAASLPGSLARGQRSRDHAAVRLDAVQRQSAVLTGRSDLRSGLSVACQPVEGEKPPPEESTDDLERIKGIGPALAVRLREAGIASAKEVASLNPERLVEILKVSVDRAREIRKAARQVARGGARRGV